MRKAFTLNYLEHFLVFISDVSGCVSICTFTSLVDGSVGIAISVVGLKICTKTAGIKKYKSVIRKKKEQHDEIVLVGKAKLDIIEGLLSKVLINSYISHDESVSVNTVLREYDEVKEEIKNPQNACVLCHL